MRFGICAAVEQSAVVRSAGWDFIEEGVQRLLQAQLADAEWTGLVRARESALPIRAANVLLPGTMKVTGPEVDLDSLRTYMQTVVRRARQVGIDIVVFGSGRARTIPEGFDREQARRQIIAFGRMSAQIAADSGVTLVAEPLNRSESNVMNSLAETMRIVREVDHPNLQCLADSYHFWLENDSLDDLRDAMPWVRHVHLADRDGRLAPGLSGTSDYRPFFAILRQANYQGLISVEASKFDIAQDGARVLEYVKTQWEQA